MTIDILTYRRELAPITDEVIAIIKKWAPPSGVCELGAGAGLWLEALRAHGIPAIGYDTAPRHPNVIRGDHIAAAQHSDMALLVVWPPDGHVIQEWISAWRGSTMMLCYNTSRVRFGEQLIAWELKEQLTGLRGRKSGSFFQVWLRKGS